MVRSEEEYGDALRALWPAGTGDADLAAIAVADEAVAAHPRSVMLWCMRGDLIQLGPAACPHPLAEAQRSYERAIALDERSVDAWESLACFHHSVSGDLAAAEDAFRRAIALGAGAESWARLARVVVERGASVELAVRLLDESPYRDDDAVREARAEIADGMWS